MKKKTKDFTESARSRHKHLQGRFFFIYAGNEPGPVLARDLGNCRDNGQNSQSVFYLVFK